MAYRTILVADDSADDVFFLTHAAELSGVDWRLTHVENGEEAIRYLEKESPDLLLVDLRMPKVDGFDVLEWIRQRPELSRLPVVVWSSSALEQDIAQAAALGAMDYVVKTGDQERLIGMVRNLQTRVFGASEELPDSVAGCEI